MKLSILTLAVTLALMAGAEPAEALSNVEKCNVLRAKVEMNFSKCLKKASLSEEKGKTPDWSKCSIRYDAGVAKVRAKFVNDQQGVGEEECELQDTAIRAAKALDVLAAGQDLGDYGLGPADLVGTAADPTSNDPSVCAAGGGTWQEGACAPGSSYNCAIGAVCSYYAAAYPEDLPDYTNNYKDDTAASSGCDDETWSRAQGDFVISSLAAVVSATGLASSLWVCE